MQPLRATYHSSACCLRHDVHTRSSRLRPGVCERRRGRERGGERERGGGEGAEREGEKGKEMGTRGKDAGRRTERGGKRVEGGKEHT